MIKFRQKEYLSSQQGKKEEEGQQYLLIGPALHPVLGDRLAWACFYLVDLVRPENSRAGPVIVLLNDRRKKE